MAYRRPGVYLEESLLVNPSDVSATTTVGCFIGVAQKGQLNEPILIESWSDFVTLFGGFDPIQPPVIDPNDRTVAALSSNTFANLAALKADPVLGDTHYTGVAFNSNDYVTLTDKSKASVQGTAASSVWSAGPIPENVTATALNGTNYANLAALKANATYGDTHYNRAPMLPGQFVLLQDASKAHVTGNAASSVWAVGPYPGASDTLITPPKVLSYLPYTVYSFFQNGGRYCWVIRSAPLTGQVGSPATVVVNGTAAIADMTSFSISARSVGTWGNAIKYGLVTQDSVDFGNGRVEDIFSIQVLVRNSNGDYETVETFSGLSVTGDPSGSRRVDTAINDVYAGSRYIRISGVKPAQPQPDDTSGGEVALAGGVDPGIPSASDLRESATLVNKVEGPITLNIVGYMNDITALDTDSVETAWVSTTIAGSSFTDRQDIIVINDSARPLKPNETSANYATYIKSPLGLYTGDSYNASYGPWVIIPDPRRVGTTLICPPGGAVMGMMARIDATVGVFRAPAGVIAGLSNAVGVQTKFTDSELGDLNNKNINMIRSVVGAGICVMGARTRKSFGADRYISARRTLISIKESLRQSTQWAVFENNDQRLWSGLRMTADRILRPMWESGGLAGVSAGDAYYVKCDATLNTPSVIQSGEVRMEVGVALEYPAEFVVIRITQFDRGTGSTSEITPTA